MIISPWSTERLSLQTANFRYVTIKEGVFLNLITSTLDSYPINADIPESTIRMDGNNITSNFVQNVSYSSFTMVPSTEEDPRILATSYLMYKIGMYENNVYDIIMYQISGLECDHPDTTGKCGRSKSLATPSLCVSVRIAASISACEWLWHRCLLWLVQV